MGRTHPWIGLLSFRKYLNMRRTPCPPISRRKLLSRKLNVDLRPRPRFRNPDYATAINRLILTTAFLICCCIVSMPPSPSDSPDETRSSSSGEEKQESVFPDLLESRNRDRRTRRRHQEDCTTPETSPDVRQQDVLVFNKTYRRYSTTPTFPFLLPPG